MNTGCFKCDKAQWDADGCTCEITGLLVGNSARGCEYRKDTELKLCPFCGGEAKYESDMNIDPLIDEDGAYVDYDRINYWERVYCTECGAEINSISEDEEEEITIKKWNRRTENEQINA